MAASKRVRITAYAASKLMAAGLVFMGFLVIAADFDGYRMSELTRELPLWEYIYGYAVLFSASVDAALCKLKAGASKIALIVLLYMLGGYVPFLIWFPGQWALSMIAGGCGAVCALVFLAVDRLFHFRWPYSAAAAILLFAGAVCVSTVDFTVTKQWKENRTAEGYHAEFGYFNGKKEIPVELEAGQTLSYRIDWQISSGGYGTYLDAKDGTYTDAEQGSITYRVKKPSAVRIVVTGDHAQGALTIAWEINN
ncbi:hypothetical protein [Paenibacillus humicola]|uniref:hypothetical protein n=1 Tax=Paenibacillus humicola TaxID=3110540 RepID=UPI00237BCC0A|nr:hypothetical protein [Paenibacillus humicola]